ncbi:polar amino acid transporter substrate-binding protein [Advenella kashmirensis WT001]|uniref:Polar amino acid transporter substrate-binding protein n=1 Tax=Advenella kashmirensis (strain DSM 17095 / LMG 22695 / WT001) TaxID=1036672 RepID=I3UEH3_ADVKW|nr:polar amino acid transporter substrate-binding protein [Advenella kashmirensis WT001]
MLDEVIAKAETSGQAAQIYHKWFETPIPPKNINLEFEMSEGMKKLFAQPSDKPAS